MTKKLSSSLSAREQDELFLPLFPVLLERGWDHVSAAGRFEDDLLDDHEVYFVHPSHTGPLEKHHLGKTVFPTIGHVIDFLNEEEPEILKGLRKDTNRIKVQTKRAKKTKANNAPIRKVSLPAKSKVQMNIWYLNNDCVVPNFQRVWKILEHQLHFRYADGEYKFPVGYEDFKGTANELRRYVIKNGAPGFNELCKDDQNIVTRWASFAFVNERQLHKLENVPSTKIALSKLKLSRNKKTRSYLFQNQVFQTREDIRSYIRGVESLAYTSDRVTRQRSSHNISAEDELQIRVWAATSKRLLPTYNSIVGNVALEVAQANANTSHSSTDDRRQSSLLVKHDTVNINNLDERSSALIENSADTGTACIGEDRSPDFNQRIANHVSPTESRVTENEVSYPSSILISPCPQIYLRQEQGHDAVIQSSLGTRGEENNELLSLSTTSEGSSLLTIASVASKEPEPTMPLNRNESIHWQDQLIQPARADMVHGFDLYYASPLFHPMHCQVMHPPSAYSFYPGLLYQIHHPNRHYVKHSDIRDDDVLCGAGNEARNHVGNFRYKSLIYSSLSTYYHAPKGKKTCVCRDIVAIINQRGGRFLEKCDDSSSSFFNNETIVPVWVEVDRGKAATKTKQHFLAIRY